METTDIIVNMTWAVLLLVGAGILAFAGKHTLVQIKSFAFELVPYLRRVFDPGSLLLAALSAMGFAIPQEKADELMELVADVVRKWAEVQPPPTPEEVTGALNRSKLS